MSEVFWARGYTRAELDAAQERFGLRFPPDLIELYLERRPVDGWDWRFDESDIRWALDRPLAGLLFDVEQNGLWWPEWGEKPADAGERADVVTGVVNAAPRLIPLIGHRYIPEEPHAAGNPVFSVKQSDVIYYGADLAEYFRNEHGGRDQVGATRRIPFWSDLVERPL